MNHLIVTNSSAIVGCNAIVLSKSDFSAPNIREIDAIWIISDALSPIIWHPKTLLLFLSTISFKIHLDPVFGNDLDKGLNIDLYTLVLSFPIDCIAFSSVIPTEAISGWLNTA